MWFLVGFYLHIQYAMVNLFQTHISSVSTIYLWWKHPKTTLLIFEIYGLYLQSQCYSEPTEASTANWSSAMWNNIGGAGDDSHWKKSDIEWLASHDFIRLQKLKMLIS